MIDSVFDKIFPVAVLLLIGTFVLGWVFLVPIMLLQAVFPRAQPKLENILQIIGKPLYLIQKISVWALIVSFVLYTTLDIYKWILPPTELRRVFTALITYFGSFVLIGLFFVGSKEAAVSLKREAKFVRTTYGKIIVYLALVGLVGVISSIIRSDAIVDYIPMEKARNELGLKIFLGLLIPSVIGLFVGFNDHKAYYIASSEDKE